MASVTVVSIASVVVVMSLFMVANARIPGVYTGGSWQTAHATFYGGGDASGTMGIPYIYTPLSLTAIFMSTTPIKAI